MTINTDMDSYPFEVQRAGEIGARIYDACYEALTSAGLSTDATSYYILDNWQHLLGAAHAGHVIDFFGVPVDLSKVHTNA